VTGLTEQETGALVSAVYWAVGTHAVRSEAELTARAEVVETLLTDRLAAHEARETRV